MTAGLNTQPEESRPLLWAATHPDWCAPVLATLAETYSSDTDCILGRKLDAERALVVRDRDRIGLLSRNRTGLLNRVLTSRDALRLTPNRDTKGEAHLDEACKMVREGLIAKRADAAYRHARSRDWLRFESTLSQKPVIGGFTPPDGGRTDLRARLIGDYENGALGYAGKVGTGFAADFLHRFQRRLDRLVQQHSSFAEKVDDNSASFVKPELVGEIWFTEWTDAGKLRHPQFKGLREAKPADDMTREKADA